MHTVSLLKASCLVSLSTLAFVYSSPASAIPVSTTPEVLVTPTRTPQIKRNIGSAVTLIDREEIEKSGYSQLFDVLKTAPGITISRNGGTGATSVLRLRGSNPGQVRVLIDGVLVNDPSNANTEFDFNHMLTEGIERVEILRGPQSALYGSDAMGGVINIITRKGDGPTRYHAMAETGSFGTHRQAGGVEGGDEIFDYSLQAEHFVTEGFSRITAGTEKDGSSNVGLTTNLGARATKNLSFRFNGGYNYLRSDFDPSSATDGPADQDKEKMYGRLSAELDTFEGIWQHIFSVQGTRTEREFDEPLGFFRYSSFDSESKSAEYQSNVHLRDRDVFTAGAMVEELSAFNTNTTGGTITTAVDAEITNKALYAQYILGIGEATTLTGGLRFDDHDLFGSATTFRANLAHNIFSTGTTLRGSIGTGFKAPTLFQLFSSFGNRNLREEENIGVDAGIDQKLLDGKLNLSATAFHTRYDDLIDFDFATSRYTNISEATTQGLESSASYDFTPEWQIFGSHTYLMTENDATNRTLPRRPKHTLKVGTQYEVFGAGHVGTDVRYVSSQWDRATGTNRTKAYTVVDVHGSVDISESVELYSRLENLFDKQYQEVRSFNAAGFGAYVGVRGNY